MVFLWVWYHMHSLGDNKKLRIIIYIIYRYININDLIKLKSYTFIPIERKIP